jgi:hypothetical protein
MADQRDLPCLQTAFASRFRVVPRQFGTPGLPDEGFSDNAQGVQWNTGLHHETGGCWLGVNLEGMKYDGWPVARLIEREVVRPRLLDLRTIDGAEQISVTWFRDAWERFRLRIEEEYIGSTPVALNVLTPERWNAVLREAYGCLNPEKSHRGRGTQRVTLVHSGSAEKWVSPHFHCRYPLWHALPATEAQAEGLMDAARRVLEPLYQWACEQSRP